MTRPIALKDDKKYGVYCGAYQVLDEERNPLEIFAIKIGPKNDYGLVNELKIVQHLSKDSLQPKILDFGTDVDDKWNFLVYEQYGISLAELLYPKVS